MSTVTGILPPAPPQRRAARVYAIAPPPASYQAAPRLAAALFGMRSVEEEGRRFSVHPVSGWLSFTDHDELWHNEGGRNLPADPQRLARAFIEEARRRVKADRQIGSVGGAIFPEDLRPRWQGEAVASGASRPDHWFCQFEAFLPIDSARVARVEGGTIDIRIGRAGRIIALRSRWRPLSGDVLSSQPADLAIAPTRVAASSFAIAPPRPATIEAPLPAGIPGRAHDHDLDTAGTSPAEGVYLMNDENAPQTFLAPFWLSLTGHHGGLEPSSAHSLRVEVMQKSAAAGTDLGAVVVGGTGQYEYGWSYWSPTDLFESGLRYAGASPDAHVPPGLWQVLLRVIDGNNGAIAQVETVVNGASS